MPRGNPGPLRETAKGENRVTVHTTENGEYVVNNTGDWLPACGGTERPFHSRSGKRLLYCWNRQTGQHAYLDLGTDLILTPEEAASALGL
jgi:hypothetical protein